MFTLIVLVCIILIGSYLISKDYALDLLAMMMIVVGSVLLLLHILAMSFAYYEYGVFVAKRNAFESTLMNARESGNEYETATITKEVAAWNSELASRKYSNSTWLLDPYIDDRIEDIEPIR